MQPSVFPSTLLGNLKGLKPESLGKKKKKKLAVGFLTYQHHASVSLEWICLNSWTCCHIEIEGEDQTCYLNQSQSTDTRPTSPSTDPISPGTWQDKHSSTKPEVSGMTQPGNIITGKDGIKPQSATLKATALTIM